MKRTPFQFRSQLTRGGEILAQQATFLPVPTTRPEVKEAVLASQRGDLASFLPVFNFNRKNLTMAQPLLKEELR